MLFKHHYSKTNVRSQLASAQDFTKARVKAEIEFYPLSKGGKGPSTIGSISPVV
jgi:hypothetical protein